MLFIDTAYLLALANKSDSLHARAMKWAALNTEARITTEYILWETINSLSRRTDRDRGHRVVELVRQNPNYSIIQANSQLLEEGLKLHRARRDKEWSLTDCISFLVMGERNISRALTHDDDFLQAGFIALLRVDP